jgi:hypothetical protein
VVCVTCLLAPKKKQRRLTAETKSGCFENVTDLNNFFPEGLKLKGQCYHHFVRGRNSFISLYVFL